MRQGTELDTGKKASAAIEDVVTKGASGRYKVIEAKKEIFGPTEVVLGGYKVKPMNSHAPDLLTLGADPELEVLDTNSNRVVNCREGGQSGGGWRQQCPFHPGRHNRQACNISGFWKAHDLKQTSSAYKCDEEGCKVCVGYPRAKVAPKDCEICECVLCQDNVSSDRAHVGLDGSGLVIELRPRACVTPSAFEDEIRDLMSIAVRKVAGSYTVDHIPNSWPFGGKTHPIGAHMHLGGAKMMELMQDERRDALRTMKGAMLTTRYLIYDWLSPFTEGGARCNQSYDVAHTYTSGQLANTQSVSDILASTSRIQAWGLEYRELPSFLVSPGLVRAVAGIMLGIWRSAISDKERKVKFARGISAYEEAGVHPDVVRQFFMELKRVADGKLEPIPVSWGVALTDAEKKTLSERATRVTAGGIEGLRQCGMCETCYENGVAHSTEPHTLEECNYPTHPGR